MLYGHGYFLIDGDSSAPDAWFKITGGYAVIPAPTNEVVSWCPIMLPTPTNNRAGNMGMIYNQYGSDPSFNWTFLAGMEGAAVPQIGLDSNDFSYGWLALAATPLPSVQESVSAMFGIAKHDSQIYSFGEPDWTTNPGSATYAPTPIGGDSTFLALEAGSDSQGHLEVFAISSQGWLCHVRQDPASSTGWGTMLPLDKKLLFTRLVVGRNPSGNSEAFAVTTSGDLYHVWEDADGKWNLDEVQLPVSGPKSIEEYDSYVVQMTALDASGATAPGAAVTISAADSVIASVNGQTVLIGPNAPWTGTCNAAGQLTLALEAMTLGMPHLLVTGDLLGAGNSKEVSPAGPVIATLKAINPDGSTLLQEKVVDGHGNERPLLGPDQTQHAGPISEAILSAMTLARAKQGAPIPIPGPFGRRNDPTVAWSRVNDGSPPGLIDLAAVPDQAWVLDFSGPVAAFRRLSPDEARVEFATIAGLSPIESIWGRLEGTFGDIVNAVREGVADLVKVGVSVAKDIKHAVDVAIHLVIDGVDYAFNAILETVEKAVNLAEVIFAKVKVGFKELVGCFGFIFNWGDILRSHRVIAYTLDQTLEAMAEVFQGLKAIIDTKIGGIESWVTNSLQNTINQFVPGATTLGAYQAENDKPNLAASSLMSANFLYTSMLNNPGASQSSSPAIVAEVSGVFTGLLDVVKDYAQRLGKIDAFGAAITYFEEIGSDPGNALNLGMAGLLSLLEGLALAILEGVEVVLNAICDAATALVKAVRDLLTHGWEIPLVTDFYQHIAKGEPLSIMNVMALVIAVPATAVYKLGFGQAPFPTDADVEAYKQGFTSAMILQSLGLGGGTAGVSSPPAPCQPGSSTRTWPTPRAWPVMRASRPASISTHPPG